MMKPKNNNVLWIDDEIQSLSNVQNSFKDSKFNVELETSVQKALERLSSRDSSYSAVIVDLAMQPEESAGGLRVAEYLRKIGNKVPIIGYSAFAREYDNYLSTDEAARFDNFIAKTESLDNVEKALNQLLTVELEHEEEIDRPHTPKIHQLDLINYELYEAITMHPELLLSMSWRKFEIFLANVLESLGYEIELTCGTKDGGIDIVAITKQSVFGSHKYLVQAKRWSNKVGVDPVRELLFLGNHHRASKSCLATTSDFTRGAWELSRQYPWQLELRDYQGLRDWVQAAMQCKFHENKPYAT